MKQILLILIISGFAIQAASQKEKYLGVALLNTQSYLPFGKFSGMFTDAFHPGVEATFGMNVNVRKKHDWFWDLRLAYFYHRFVQHGIPLYTNFGYRYKFNRRISVDAALGAGYMHSIPATAKLKFNGNDNYENNKGIGRMQANVCFGVGAGYWLNQESKKPLKLFITYQQRLQLPFVRSYVPILPYNSFMIGIYKPLTLKPDKKN